MAVWKYLYFHFSIAGSSGTSFSNTTIKEQGQDFTISFSSASDKAIFTNWTFQQPMAQKRMTSKKCQIMILTSPHPPPVVKPSLPIELFKEPSLNKKVAKQMSIIFQLHRIWKCLILNTPHPQFLPLETILFFKPAVTPATPMESKPAAMPTKPQTFCFLAELEVKSIWCKSPLKIGFCKVMSGRSAQRHGSHRSVWCCPFL